ncbi:hypothetical protein NLD30_02255 [SCandidatus Aminicenantes bacterium Aminicenantia_JdfR_composite]|nr:hypothetical protein [SCandidatus Aminicenantes bacterium Aminicenantia_JdfR_composite]MCP2597772.1 hypothetical protein [Candidatus Aminicenantes bacterium AC-335-L06]MCP2620497.1 hypothetical protein [Candidatus Aminicenantes bacterium AC-334-E05]
MWEGGEYMIGSTGERCPETGTWECISCGKKISLRKDEIFPLCENCQITAWRLISKLKNNAFLEKDRI